MGKTLKTEKVPKGMTLKHTLRGHGHPICVIAWSPDGRTLASGSRDSTIQLWNSESGQTIRTLIWHKDDVKSIAWSPNGKTLASGSGDRTIRLWNPESGQRIRSMEGHVNCVYNVAWAPDGKILASRGGDRTIRLWNPESGKTILSMKGNRNSVCSVAWAPDGKILASEGSDKTIRLWNPESGKTILSMEGHTNLVVNLAWLPDGQTLASGSEDKTIRLWDTNTGRTMHLLEGHTDSVESLSLSPNNRLLASKSADGTVRFWRTDTWDLVVILDEPGVNGYSCLAFHPTLPILATLGKNNTVIRIWELDIDVLFGTTPTWASVRYAAAKIVLVGESGVGKTGLGWRLAHDEYKKHDSTHGQQFWLLDQLKAKRNDGTECEAVLWDLAGQPDYRLIHGLFLDDADLALVLFNPADQTEPLRGVDFWLKSLSHRQDRPCRTILVGARCDVGDSTLTQDEIEDFCRDREINSGYVLTSALTSKGIDELIERMKGEVAWEKITATTTDVTFKRIKEYVLELKEDTDHIKILVDWAGLRQRLEALDADWKFTNDEMTTAVEHLAKHGYVRIMRTSQGEQRILLAPDLLNNLAASFVLEARRNPKGLGSLDEQFVRENQYRFREVEDLSEEERDILLDATTALFIEHNVAFRESYGQTSYLIFPELINQKKPLLGGVEIFDGVSYSISGSIENIYAVLVVLLGYTDIFSRTNQWQSQAQYEVGEGEVCGFRQISERPGEIDLVLYYCEKASELVQKQFQVLFERFLSRRNVTVTRYPPLVCPNYKCSYRQERAEVVKRTQQGRGFIFCSECGEKISIPKEGEEIILSNTDRRLVDQQQKTANMRTHYETALTHVLAFIRKRGKELRSPSCFISYAWGVMEDERWIEKRLTRDLQNASIEVILDRWHNAKIGGDVARFISRIEKCNVIVVVGTPLYLEKYENKLSSTGNVVAAEVDLINQRLLNTEEQKETINPVLLKGTSAKSLPPLLRGKVHGDFRNEENYFSTLFDLILSLYGVPFDSQAVIDLREKLRFVQE